MQNIGFHEENVWTDKYALIDPGYPFIAMPKDEFVHFIEDLLTVHPEHNIKCDEMDWCTFNSTCDQVRDKVPDMTFKFPVKAD